MSHLHFQEIKTKKKTKTFGVISSYDGSHLGVIKFKSQWRQYCLFPASDTYWSSDCLAAVSRICELLTVQWRRGK